MENTPYMVHLTAKWNCRARKKKSVKSDKIKRHKNTPHWTPE